MSFFGAEGIAPHPRQSIDLVDSCLDVRETTVPQATLLAKYKSIGDVILGLESLGEFDADI